MRILVIGSGGREHALAWKLSQDHEVFCAPGNPGIAEVANLEPIGVRDFDGLVGLARRISPDLVVVGPEDPLVEGLADVLRGAGYAVYGPGAAGARLEASKAFSKEIMAAAGVPTAAFGTFREANEAIDFARSRFDAGRGVAVKASGNALGKGVVVCGEFAEAETAIREMLETRIFGEAGATIVVEDRLLGREFSLLTLVSDAGILSLPVAQDYKRIGDGDSGPNTGGMGTVSPAPWVSKELIALTEAEVVAPTLRALTARGIEFRGTLFSGLLVEDGVPYCLEYNVRFGDPETQSVVRRLGDGFGEALRACALGQPIPAIERLPHAAVTVVLASEGYPGEVVKGRPISLAPLPEGTVLFHAGTARGEGQLLTAGGRVFGLSAIGATVEEARANAYAALPCVRFEGAQHRTDIGAFSA